ncbi:MAG: response regulator, partial [Phycisphaeraceae bacterium]|nr:response regulator [Phycisphaeraceae bacterium]
RLQPIGLLSRTIALAAEHGRFDRPLGIRGNDEISRMAQAFDHMAGTITRQVNDLQDARRAAEQADKAKSRFLSHMSHEIRTPMTSILGFTDLIAQDNQDAGQRRQWVGAIRRNGERLLQLVSDVLDLTQIETGGIEMLVASCDPTRLVEDIITELLPKAVGKGLALRLRHRGSMPESIMTDPARLQQILRGLVDNGIKFTEQGKVEVQMAFHAAPAARLQFWVRDTGPGMTTDQLASIFQPFRQADESMTRRYGGCGVELVLSQHIAHRLGGHIIAASYPGEGSIFSLILPVSVPAQAMPAAEPKPCHCGAAPSKPESAAVSADKPLAGARVLLAEDGPDNQRLVSYVLRKHGAEVIVVDNGKDAVDRALQAAASHRLFHLILMDMQMPVMDGYEATRTLRQAGYLCPIVALTAHALDSDRQQCLDAGCDEFATKPIRTTELVRIGTHYYRTASATTDSAHAVA